MRCTGEEKGEVRGERGRVSRAPAMVKSRSPCCQISDTSGLTVLAGVWEAGLVSDPAGGVGAGLVPDLATLVGEEGAGLVAVLCVVGGGGGGGGGGGALAF